MVAEEVCDERDELDEGEFLAEAAADAVGEGDEGAWFGMEESLVGAGLEPAIWVEGEDGIVDALGCGG